MKKLTLLCALMVLSGAQLMAETVYVTARPRPTGTGPNTDGTYAEVSITLGDSSAVSGAPGSPARGGSRAYLSSTPYANNQGGIDITPTLTNDVYQIDYTSGAGGNGNITLDATFNVSCTGGVLSFNVTDKFQQPFEDGTWQLMGYFTNDFSTTTPTISFRYDNGTITASRRLNVDCFRLTHYVPCSVVPVPTVMGPIAAGATGNVSVRGLTNIATAVTVYQDTSGFGTNMLPIGKLTSGIVSGTNVVSVTNLIKGAKLSATQTIAGQEGCIQESGPIVGGGANPRLRVALSIRYNPALTGPVGANGGTATACIWFMGATNILTGSSPGDCKYVVYPSNTWQTLTWQRDPDATNGGDATVIWNNNSCGASLDGNFGILESIALVEDDLTDTGPIDIYIDNLTSGGVVFQDFESAAVGTQGYGFRQPAFSGTTANNILGGAAGASPNDSIVTDATADTGSKCLHVRYQYSGLASNQWLRLTTSSAGGTPNPKVDLTQPISFRLLMLPVGQQVASSPLLTIQRSATNVVLNWTGTFNLQYKTNLSDATWVNVGVTAGPYTNSAASGTKFFRLQGL